MDILKSTFVLPVNGKYLIHSPLSKTTALLNKKAALEIKRMLRNASAILETTEQLNQLFTHFSKIKILPKKQKGEINPEFLGIIPTRLCNGACNYCDFGAGSATNQIMALRMASRAVDWYTGLVKKKKKETLEVHFFGGEPMTAMEVVETVVHRTRYKAAEENLRPVFEISTNGQYSAEKAEFVGTYFNSVILSLDGFEHIQNTHRPLKNGNGSFDNAVLTGKIISGSHAQLHLRACVSNKNVHQMEEISSWFCQEFNPFSINFEALRATSDTSVKGLFPPDPFSFAINLIKARIRCQAHGVPLVYATDITDYPTFSSCPVGKDTAIVSPDGRISNCYLMPEKWREVNMDLDVGKINDNKEILINKENLNAIRNFLLKKPRCSKCFCRWSCAGGCHVCNTFPGAGIEYNGFCIQTRIISLCTLLFDLGMDNEVTDFLNNRITMESFASQSSDLLTDIK